MPLYKFDSMGYFAGVSKVSRGPWFRDGMVEDDGLDWMYTYRDMDGKKTNLSSNNIAVKDRMAMSHLYHEMNRCERIFTGLGLYLGWETSRFVPQMKAMAPGWRFLAVLGLGGFVYKNMMCQYWSAQYRPVIGAFLRKYSSEAKNDKFDINDDKKKYFYIDTSEYMNYSNQTLSDDYHCSHGAQPEGEAMDSTYLVEVDKFLRGEENSMKAHPKYKDYPYEF